MTTMQQSTFLSFVAMKQQIRKDYHNVAFQPLLGKIEKTLDASWECQSLLRKKKQSNFLTDNLHSNPDMIIGLQLPIALKKWTLL